MALKIHKFVRKPLYVDVVRINRENMAEVAEWCGGRLTTTTVVNNGVTEEVEIIKLRVPRPMSARQTQGFVGDWVLKTKSSFKIYTPRAFDKQFEKVRGTLTKAQADAAGIRPPIEKRAPKVVTGGETIEDGRIKTGALSSQKVTIQKVTQAELEKLAQRHCKH